MVAPDARPTVPASPALPVDAVLPDVVAALAGPGMAVLEAPPGAGKTTRVPLALLDAGLHGRLVLLEPRRVAARAAAHRLAAHLGERVGDRVGLTTRDERRTSAATRIEVVTEGVLLRRLQRDPELADVEVLLFDEFHERNLEADLALAFACEVRTTVRPDLRLLVASATLDGDRVARLLGGAPVVRAEGRTHPVTVEHRERVEVRWLAEAVRDTVAGVLDAGDGGDVLVFLPGAREIRATARALADRPPAADAVVLPLHGSLAPTEQDAALRPAPPGRRKVVLATDVAESSITIEGVTAVVDAGLSREPRFDPATGMTGLVTVPASRASAEQRAGRAGRTAPGRCVRLWPEREHAGRDAHPRPAITTDDLTGAALEVAAWGTDVADLALLDPPPTASWERASQTLRALGALDDTGRVTAHGRELVGLPLHPRLGHLLVRGAELGLGRLAAQTAAVLADRDLLATGPDRPVSDLTVRVRVLRGAPPPSGSQVRGSALARARREARRLERMLGRGDRSAAGGDGNGADRGRATSDLDRIGALVALGWPERVAGLRAGTRGTFLLAGGRGATLPDGDVLAGEPCLAVAHLDRGATEARIHLAAPVDATTLTALLPDQVEDVEEVGWRDGDVVAERRRQFGALVLDRRRVADPDADAVLAALVAGLRDEGLGLLRWRAEDRHLQARLAFLRRHAGPAWPDVGDDALLAEADTRLAPFLLGARRRADLARVAARDVLTAALTPTQLRDVDRLAPTHLGVPSGSRVRLDWTAGDRPVLAVRVQEVFGATRTPAVLDGRVPVLVHLLSPARRPVQVTDDLAGFWERAYPQVRAELRGRYPKHAWPQDPTTAPPMRGTRRPR